MCLCACMSLSRLFFFHLFLINRHLCHELYFPVSKGFSFKDVIIAIIICVCVCFPVLEFCLENIINTIIIIAYSDYIRLKTGIQTTVSSGHATESPILRTLTALMDTPRFRRPLIIFPRFFSSALFNMSKHVRQQIYKPYPCALYRKGSAPSTFYSGRT